jgi:hypothetical protein
VRRPQLRSIPRRLARPRALRTIDAELRRVAASRAGAVIKIHDARADPPEGREHRGDRRLDAIPRSRDPAGDTQSLHQRVRLISRSRSSAARMTARRSIFCTSSTARRTAKRSTHRSSSQARPGSASRGFDNWKNQTIEWGNGEGLIASVRAWIEGRAPIRSPLTSPGNVCRSSRLSFKLMNEMIFDSLRVDCAGQYFSGSRKVLAKISHALAIHIDQTR